MAVWSMMFSACSASAKSMDWVESSKTLFDVSKPKHFTDFTHCEECAEHDLTLRSSDVDSIGMNKLGNAFWDPICFCSEEGKKYYFPALVRLCLDTINGDFYLDQFLFHMEYDGPENTFYLACSKEQRKYIASFLEYILENYPEEIEKNLSAESALKTYEMWRK